MPRRILVVTHGGVAPELVAIARDLLGNLPALESLSVTSADSLETLSASMSKWAGRLPQRSRGLILTDLRNSSATVAALSLAKKFPVDCVCGVNLPLLLKALSSSEPPLDELIEVGRSGVDVVGRPPARPKSADA